VGRGPWPALVPPLPNIPCPRRVRPAHHRTSNHHISLHHTMKIRGRRIDRQDPGTHHLDPARPQPDRVPIRVTDYYGTRPVFQRDPLTTRRLQFQALAPIRVVDRDPHPIARRQQLQVILAVHRRRRLIAPVPQTPDDIRPLRIPALKCHQSPGAESRNEPRAAIVTSHQRSHSGPHVIVGLAG